MGQLSTKHKRNLIASAAIFAAAVTGINLLSDKDNESQASGPEVQKTAATTTAVKEQDVGATQTRSSMVR